ncbi:hypothetical protein PVK06_027197 [Gossypium arboreum]|uniref:Uncharacterized protein n=1 Tax=Gossypium arboreum TaxID=29729 RepID=A0ABR0P2K4_GOSAR|nr:hypothetical protein PVK06_027197 [Gossypium arboreum]
MLNSEVLSNRSDMMAQMMKEIFKRLPLRKEDMSDVHNSDHKNPGIINDHNKIHGEIQPKLVIEDHGNEFNIVKTVSNPIDIAAEVAIKVKVEDELTTNMEFKLILNKSVEDLIHFLAISEKVSTEEVGEFDSFSFDNKNKAQATKV